MFSKIYSQLKYFSTFLLMRSVRQPKLKIQSVTFEKFIRNTYRNPYETAKTDEELFEIEHYFKRQRAGTKR